MSDVPAIPGSPKFGFVKIVCQDLDAQRAFYEKVFGLQMLRDIVQEDFRELMMASPGMETGPFVILFQHSDGRKVTIENGWGPVGFFVSNAEEAYAHALANGAKPSKEPYGGDGVKIAFYFDPEGHEVELIQF